MATKILKRKNKATDQRLEIILDCISRGYSQRDAARLAGISEDTISNWKKDSDFSEQMEQKEIEYKYSLLKIIQDAGQKSWQACAWILERKYHSEYGKPNENETVLALYAERQQEILKKLSGMFPD
jgi:transcriptional regulator with XRE-family HTH domain